MRHSVDKNDKKWKRKVNQEIEVIEKEMKERHAKANFFFWK